MICPQCHGTRKIVVDTHDDPISCNECLGQGELYYRAQDWVRGVTQTRFLTDASSVLKSCGGVSKEDGMRVRHT